MSLFNKIQTKIHGKPIGMGPKNHYSLFLNFHRDSALQSIMSNFLDLRGGPFGYDLKNVIQIMGQELMKYNLMDNIVLGMLVIHVGVEPPLDQLLGHLKLAADLFCKEELYAHAFGFYAIATFISAGSDMVPTCGNNLIEKAMDLKPKLEDGSFDEAFEVFNPLFKIAVDGTKNCTVYRFLSMLLDEKLSLAYYTKVGGGQEYRVKGRDLEVQFLSKRIKYEWLPRGMTPFLFKILKCSLECMQINDKQFKQARHLISVVGELMKSCDQSTDQFRKLNDTYLMFKVIYWGLILAYSELQEAIVRVSGGTDGDIEKLFKFSDHLIELGVNLPNGEDAELPIQLIKTSEEREALYKLIKKQRKFLIRSSIKEIRNLYKEYLKIDVNFFICSCKRAMHHNLTENVISSIAKLAEN